ncbi:MAG: hypothetical protein AB8D78_00405, partial [Akkermansiaceae bacterium]
MSIHAHLSEEAQAQLRAQKRNSTISSIIISILVIVLIFLVLGIFLLPNIIKESPTIVTYTASLAEETEIQEKKVKNQIQKKPSAPTHSMSKVIASTNTSPTAIPVPDIEVTTPSADFGDGQDFGGGWGEEGFGGGGGFGRVPQEMRKRCSKADRMARLTEMGGTPECEEAVVKALDWLQKTQNSDGSWTSSYPVAMTGFAILAYLGHCETPLSEKYGETVLKGITYLINIGLKNDFHLTNKGLDSNQWVYEHGIATYALAEAYTFCSKLNINIPDLDTVTKKAGDKIMDGQGDSGGWVYRFASTNSGDNSVGFWQIQAMKACKHTGLWKDSKFKKYSRKSLDWLSKAQGKNGAVGYRGSASKSPGLTGGAVLAFQMWGEGKSKEARKGLGYIKENMDFKWGSDNANLYYHYYNAQATINEGGKLWADYNKIFRDELIKAQKPDGS